MALIAFARLAHADDMAPSALVASAAQPDLPPAASAPIAPSSPAAGASAAALVQAPSLPASVASAVDANDSAAVAAAPPPASAPTPEAPGNAARTTIAVPTGPLLDGPAGIAPPPELTSTPMPSASMTSDLPELPTPPADSLVYAGHDVVLQAQAAWRRKDVLSLQQLRDDALATRHPLAPWIDYWELNARLDSARADELAAFYARWPASYVEDRLRNDWLLELGKRRDFAQLARELPAYRMRDDKEVDCWSVLLEHRRGGAVADRARELWFGQRDPDDGCQTMAAELFLAGALGPADAWRKARLSADLGRPRAARHAAALLGVGDAVAAVFQNPQRYLLRDADTTSRTQSELTTLALIRLAVADPDAAALQLEGKWAPRLPPPLAAWAWQSTGKQAALKLLPRADDYFRRARAFESIAPPEDRPEGLHAWRVRAALRADDPQRWDHVVDAIEAMPKAEQQEPGWVYWRARALAMLAQRGDKHAAAQQVQSRKLFESIADSISFYGKLAAEELGQRFTAPPVPTTLTDAERAAAARLPGLQRALQLIAAGVRSEGVREWNYTVGWGKTGGWSDRELRAIAQLACDQGVWDRCINTSEKTRREIDMAQRFPQPFRVEVLRSAEAVGLDAAYVYGLIRQESRFVADARSNVGASGLMQVMPATARWTARRLGIPYSQGLIDDRNTNLRIGSGYLRLLVDDFGASLPMATAAYNAGPNRPRKWREGASVEPAVWAETIPFSETRDYVKKVLSNTTVYAALLNGSTQSLRARLGESIGPAAPGAAGDPSLP